MVMKRVPMSVVKGRSQFPAGHYTGVMKEVEEGGNEAGTSGSINFQLHNINVVEGDANPGARPHFVRITTWITVKDARGKEESLLVADIDPSDEEVPFQLRSAVQQLTCLAIQLGAATVDGTNVEFQDDLETFMEALRSGTYEGSEIEFVVSHSVSKKEREAAKTEGRQPKAFVNTEFVIPEAGAQATATQEAETETTETEEVEEAEVEEEAPAKAPTRPSLVKGAQARQVTKPVAKAPVGSGKAKFVRKGK